MGQQPSPGPPWPGSGGWEGCMGTGVPSCHFIFLSQDTATGYPGQANGLSPNITWAPQPLKASPPQNRLELCVTQADPISPVWAEGKAHLLLSLSLVPLSPYKTSVEPTGICPTPYTPVLHQPPGARLQVSFRTWHHRGQRPD